MSEGASRSFRTFFLTELTFTQGTINTRINILYLLDSLCEASLLSKATSSSTSGFYVDFVTRDLATIVDYVVPEGREGLINLMSAVQVCLSLRSLLSSNY